MLKFDEMYTAPPGGGQAARARAPGQDRRKPRAPRPAGRFASITARIRSGWLARATSS
jgi:hypothetical protein